MQQTQPDDERPQPPPSVNTFDRASIAGRIRGLLGDSRNLVETAKRLGLDELSLRMSVDEVSPHPTVDVLAAVIHHYGVDPSWLLTGTYDSSTHRTADERSAAITALKDFVASRTPPANEFASGEFLRPKEKH